MKRKERHYRIKPTLNYDKTVSLDGNVVSCFSPAKMILRANKRRCNFAGEICSNNKKDEVAKLLTGGRIFAISKSGTHSRRFYKDIGYLCVTKNTYITVLERRASLVPALCGIALAFLPLLLLTLFVQTSTPVVSNPNQPPAGIDIGVAGGTENDRDNTSEAVSEIVEENFTEEVVVEPTSEIDSSFAEEITEEETTNEEITEEDTSSDFVSEIDTDFIEETTEEETEAETKSDQDVGVNAPPNLTHPSTPNEGALAVVFSKKATINIVDSTASMYFKNKNESKYDIRLVLRVIVGDEEIVLAESELIKAGCEVRTLEVNSSQLEIGVYNGEYNLIYYDKETGELVQLASKINIEIIVK